MVVSGGDETELRDIFIARNLAPLFNINIFGSPDSKDVILAREIKKGSIVLPALFLGDSRYDYIAASTAGLDFIFVHGWTDFVGWKEFCILNGIATIKQTSDLLPN
jgi:phosphoglycolate phosphatase-like HAD superfamily hydrolase